MLLNTKQLYGNKLGALDGDIGHIKDFYFDDKTWVIRYLVADTGNWLPGRRVLLSPHVFGEWDETDKVLQINLKRARIENSPTPDSHQPVSRQYEMEFYRYYSLPVYWEGTNIWGMGGYPFLVPLEQATVETHPKQQHRSDKHLQSTHSVTGSHIQARDGMIGRVTGFLVDNQKWTIGDVVVETGHWYAGKEILIPTDAVERISYADSKVFVNLTQADIQHTAENAIAHAGTQDLGP